MIAEEAFPVINHIMKPYPMRSLTKEKQIFNYRLRLVRRIVENAFGILSSRFQVPRFPIRLHPDKADTIILSTCLLYNSLRKDRSIIQHDITYLTIDLHNFIHKIILYITFHFVISQHPRYLHIYKTDL